MPRNETRRWEANLAGGSRRKRMSFTYEAFVPDPIAALNPLITFETGLLVAEAENAVAALNSKASVLGFECIGPLLLRSEAVASSRIEKLAVSQQNLARALVDPRAAKGTALLVAANVLAMEQAICIADRPGPLSVADIAEIHRVLMAPDSDQEDTGRIRQEQNWLGGSSDSPIDAVFIPPPYDLVESLLDDLVRFLEREDLPAVAQAAIAHAQFETIHPFTDGNGRVGRALVHLVLRRRKIAPSFVPPVSVVLAARPDSYISGLVGYREGQVEGWVASFATACSLAAGMSQELADAVRGLQQQWTEAVRPRAGSAAERIIKILPAQPVLTTVTARAAIGSGHEAARLALATLEEAGIVREVSSRKWDRTYAASSVFDLIKTYEDKIRGRSIPLD